MQIMVNTDNHINGSAALNEKVHAQVENKLKRFEDHLSRIEVHFNDENAHKGGGLDKRCQIEARPKGQDPVSASHNGDNLEQALDGAMKKLATILERLLDRQQHH